MIPPNWHIVDDESITEMMAETLRDAVPVDQPPALDPVDDSQPASPRIPVTRRRFPLPKPVPLVPRLIALSPFIAYLSLPVLCLAFDASAWSLFIRLCNMFFEAGSGDIWAMRWIGWSQRHKMDLALFLVVWSVLGGGILFGFKRIALDLYLISARDIILKWIRDTRLQATRWSSRATETGEG